MLSRIFSYGLYQKEIHTINTYLIERKYIKKKNPFNMDLFRMFQHMVDLHCWNCIHIPFSFERVRPKIANILGGLLDVREVV